MSMTGDLRAPSLPLAERLDVMSVYLRGLAITNKPPTEVCRHADFHPESWQPMWRCAFVIAICDTEFQVALC